MRQNSILLCYIHYVDDTTQHPKIFDWAIPYSNILVILLALFEPAKIFERAIPHLSPIEAGLSLEVELTLK